MKERINHRHAPLSVVSSPGLRAAQPSTNAAVPVFVLKKRSPLGTRPTFRGELRLSDLRLGIRSDAGRASFNGEFGLGFWSKGGVCPVGDC
jgi:hypothetical protein